VRGEKDSERWIRLVCRFQAQYLAKLTENPARVEMVRLVDPEGHPRARAGCHLTNSAWRSARRSERAASAAPPDRLEDRHQKMPWNTTRLPRMPKR